MGNMLPPALTYVTRAKSSHMHILWVAQFSGISGYQFSCFLQVCVGGGFCSAVWVYKQCPVRPICYLCLVPLHTAYDHLVHLFNSPLSQGHNCIVDMLLVFGHRGLAVVLCSFSKYGDRGR